MNIPGLICAAEHYDLPELLQACFHHAKQFVNAKVVRHLLRKAAIVYKLEAQVALRAVRNCTFGVEIVTNMLLVVGFELRNQNQYA